MYSTSSKLIHIVFPLMCGLWLANFVVGAPLAQDDLTDLHRSQSSLMDHTQCPLGENSLNWVTNILNMPQSVSHIRLDDVTKVINGRDITGLFSFRNMSVLALPQIMSQTKLSLGPDMIRIRVLLENLIVSGNYEISNGQLRFGLGDINLWNGSLFGQGQFTLGISNVSLFLRVGLDVEPTTELVSIYIFSIDLVAHSGSVCDNIQVQFSNLTVNDSPFDGKRSCQVAKSFKHFYPLYVTHQLNSFVEGCTMSDLRRVLNRHSAISPQINSD